MNAYNDYASTATGASSAPLNVVSRRYSDEMEDGRGRASPSASPTLSFLSAPPAATAAATAAKGVREEVGPTVTAIAKAFKADEKTQEVTKKAEGREREKKADRRARDLAAVRSLTAQISDMLARQRIGDGAAAEPPAAVAEPESAAEPAAAASEPRQQQEDKQQSEDGSDEDEWANASLAFVVDDCQRERRRDHDSYSKILGATTSRSRRRRVRSARLGAGAPELGGSEGAAEEISAPPAPIAKMGGGKSVDDDDDAANHYNRRIVPFPRGASGTRCNASHALSA